MIGEFDYDSLFFGDNLLEDPDGFAAALLPYRTVTLIFFLGFLMIMPIVIMNLLVRLYTLVCKLSLRTQVLETIQNSRLRTRKRRFEPGSSYPNLFPWRLIGAPLRHD
jgi:hypothetical protein